MARLVAKPDVENVYEGIIEGARSFLGADRCAVVRMNASGDHVEYIATHGLSDEFAGHFCAPGRGDSLPGCDCAIEVYEDVETDPRIGPMVSQFRREGCRSAMIAPMIYEGQLMGTLSVCYDDPRRIPETDRHLLQVFATLAAGASENSRAHAENAKWADRLRAINEVGLAVSSALDQKTLFETVHEQMGRVLRCDAFYIAMYDPESDVVRPTFSADRGQTFGPEEARPLGAGPCAWVLRNLKPYFLTPDNASIQGEGGQFGSEDRSRSAIHVPMMLGARVIGAMSVQSYAEDVYDEKDQWLLQIIAGHIAVALENARLFDEQKGSARQNSDLLQQSAARAGRLAVLNEIGMAVSQVLDMDALYEVVYQQTRRAIKVDTFYIALWHPDRNEISFPFEKDLGMRRLSAPIPLDGGLSSRVIQERTPCVINDVLAVSPAGGRLLGTGPNCQSTIHVPIMLGETVLGALSVQSYEQNAYDEEDVLMLQTVAGQTAIALENARLFSGQTDALEEIRRLNEQSEARANRLAVLNEVGLAVSRVQDLDSLYQEVYEQVSRVLTVDAFYIILWDDETQQLTSGFNVDIGRRFYNREPQSLGNGPTSWVVKNQKPFVLRHETADTQLKSAPFGGPERSRSAIHVPMMLGGCVLGVMSAQSYAPDTYNDDDLWLLQSVATQTAVAVENARLFLSQDSALRENQRLNEQNAARADRMAVLNEVGMAVSRVLDLDELCDVVCQQTSRVLKVDAFFIAVWHPSERCIEFTYVVDRGIRRATEIRALDDGPCSQVLRDGASRLVNNLSDVEALGGQPFGTGDPSSSAMFVPMRMGQKVVGVVSAQSYEADAYSEEDVQMLETVAGQTTVALVNARLFSTQSVALDENARLHAESTRRAERLKVLNEAGVALSGSLELEALYKVVHNQAARIVPLDCFYIALWSPESEALTFTFFDDKGIADKNVDMPLGDGPSGWVIRNRKPYLAVNVLDPVQQAGLYYGSGPDAQSAVHVPLMIGERIIGVMSAQSYSAGCYTEEDAQFLETLAGQAAVAVENARLYQAVQAVSLTDELTGLPNRRAIATRLEEELSRSARYGCSLCLLMLDLDHFKSVNDTLGHAAGDGVLRELGLLLRGSLRSHDSLGRWGGEEFLILLVHTDLEGGQIVAENLRKRVEGHAFLGGRLGRAQTVSIGGVAMEPPAQWELPDAVEAADECLYEAKETGRNCTVFRQR